MRAESRLSWLAVAGGSALCATAAAVGADARWLAALGSAIVRAGHIPSSIPYAAAPSHDWVNVPVLGELVFHWLDSLGGDRALVVSQAVAIAVTLAFVLRDMRRAGASDVASAFVLVLLPFAGAVSFLVVRAQMFSLPLFALTMLLLRADARRRSARIWLLVPLVALWSNLHGAVLTGLVLATVYLLIERCRHERWPSLGVLACAWAALFATPAFARTGEYYVGVLQSEPAATGFGLWAPLSLHNPFDVVFVAVAALFLWLAVRAAPKSWELVAIVLLAIGTVHVGRNSVWLALFAAVPAACGLRLGGRAPKGALLACAWILPVVLFVAAFSRGPTQTVASASLRAHAVRLAGGAPILADAEDAEQLALDGHRVWIANPIDAFGRDDQRTYLQWLQGDAAGDRALRGHDVVLVRIESDPQRRLARSRAFREVRRDELAVLYRRVS